MDELIYLRTIVVRDPATGQHRPVDLWQDGDNIDLVSEHPGAVLATVADLPRAPAVPDADHAPAAATLPELAAAHNALVASHNTLLANLRAAGLMEETS